MPPAHTRRSRSYLLFEHVRGGELFFHIQMQRRLTLEQARFYAAEVAIALAFLHHHDVLYRDLKPGVCLFAPFLFQTVYVVFVLCLSFFV
jgi:serine/threonine protein kinase